MKSATVNPSSEDCAVAASKTNVVFVLAKFPVSSEQFVVREVKALTELGVRVRILTTNSRRHRQDTLPFGNVEVSRSWPMWRSKFWRPVLAASVRRPRKCVELAVLAFRVGAKEGWLGRLRAIRLALIALSFARIVGENNRPIIHAHFASAPTTLGLLLSQWIGCPFGFSIHARDLYAEPLNLALKTTHAVRVITCSKTAANDVRQKLPQYLHARVHAIYHGVDLEAIQPRVSARCQREPLILAIGRFEVKKGFNYLVRGCAILRDEGFPFRCEIVGDGSGAAALRALIEMYKLRDLVRICGWRTPSELVTYYLRATVLAVPSVVAPDGDRDNIPNVILEALASGTPVVASALPAITEVLGPTEAGILIPPQNTRALADGLRRVCADMDLASRLGERGRALAEEEFDIRVNARRLLKLLTENE